MNRQPGNPLTFDTKVVAMSKKNAQIIDLSVFDEILLSFCGMDGT